MKVIIADNEVELGLLKPSKLFMDGSGKVFIVLREETGVASSIKVAMLSSGETFVLHWSTKVLKVDKVILTDE